jgi:hypothetical protein
LEQLFTAIPWGNVSAGALAAFGVFSIYRGWLWTRPAVTQMIELYKAMIQDRDEQIAELKRTNTTLDARNDLLANQVKQLVEIGHTTSAVLTALPRE